MERARKSDVSPAAQFSSPSLPPPLAQVAESDQSCPLRHLQEQKARAKARTLCSVTMTLMVGGYACNIKKRDGSSVDMRYTQTLSYRTALHLTSRHFAFAYPSMRQVV